MEESKNRNKNIILDKRQFGIVKEQMLITESQESKSIHAAKKLVMQRLGFDEDRADAFIRNDIRESFSALKTLQGGKFILGVVRMFLNMEFNDASTISDFDATLKLVSSDKHINEFDRNLNGMSCNELIQMFSREMSEILDADKKEVNSMEFTEPSDYDIVRIDSFEQASEYSKYTAWCVTNGKGAFDSNTNNGCKQFYFCLKHGFESVPARIGEGCPLDEYGLSMLAVLVNENGSLSSCTCRWNHANGGNGAVMNAKQISETVGVNFYETFKPNNKWEKTLSKAMEKLAYGEDPKHVFDKCGDFEGDFAVVKLKNKWNFLTKNGNILSDTWFDYCFPFKYGFAFVELNDKWNYLTTDGKILSNTWFDDCYVFQDGFAIVELNGKRYKIDTNGAMEEDTLEEGKSTNKNVILTEDQFDIFRELILEGGDSRLKPVKNIIKAAFEGTALNPDAYVTSAEYQTPNRGEKTTWMHYLIYSLRHYFDLMGNGDVTMLKNVAKIAFLDLNFEKENQDIEKLNILKKIIYLIKNDDNAKAKFIQSNDVTFNSLYEQYSGVLQQMDYEERNAVNSKTYERNSRYEIIPIDDFETAQELGKYTGDNGQGRLCYTERESTWNSFTNNGNNQCYLCYVPNYKEIPPQKGEGYPKDEYGLSMIWIFVDGQGRLSNSNVRWNHGDRSYGNVDEIFTESEISDIVGVNFYKTFKPNNKWKEIVSKAMEKIAKGADPKDVFDYYKVFKNGLMTVLLNNKWNLLTPDGKLLSETWFDRCFADLKKDFLFVQLNGKWNFLTPEGKILSNTWFDNCGNFNDGLAVVCVNNKWNYLTTEGKLLSDTWFDYCYNFENGFARVELNGEQNFLTTDGNLLSDTWFDSCGSFRKGFASVQMNDKYNFINTDGKILSKIWFDEYDSFKEGFSHIELNGKYNFLNTDGQILNDTWFDSCDDFKEGFARVALNSKWNFIATDGQILSDTWFDACSNFDNGYATVILKGMHNFLTNDGKILSDVWFDNCHSFRNGFAYVELDDKCNFVTTDGKILSNVWFDNCYPFKNGFAEVRLNGKWYNLDANGTISKSSIGEGKTANKNVMLAEEQFGMLNEGVETKNMSAAKHYIYNFLGRNDENKAMEIIGGIKHDIPNSRLAKCKFMLGIVRMFLNRELNDAATIGNLDATLKLVSSDKHINEFDRNLNGVSCNELIQMFSNEMSEVLDADKKEVNGMKFTEPSDYDIVRIDSFDEASIYGKYTDWCVTHGKAAFDTYTNNGYKQFYFCLKHGFEGVPKEMGEGCPLDEYGLSMIAVLVNENGSLAHCTCRWNHDNKGNDNVMNATQVSKVVGVNFYKTFKPNGKWQDMVSKVLKKIAKGANPKDVFDYCGDFEEGFVAIELNGKYNFLTTDKKFLSDIWFDDCNDFEDGLAIVELNNKCNFLTTDGKLLSDTWFDGCRYFKEGLAVVRLNGKWNFLTTDGKILSDTWFDGCHSFQNGFARVKLNNKWNFLATEAQILSNIWFDGCDIFINGLAIVALNDKVNFLTTDGKILSDVWFDECRIFHDGFSIVELKGKWNFLTTYGNVLSDTWFDYCNRFKNGLAIVELNHKNNVLTTDGKFISNTWFDFCYNFEDGFALVALNGKYNSLTIDGQLLSDTWFDSFGVFKNGFAKVELHGKYNFITTDGKILSDVWFDECSDFHDDGFAIAQLNGKRYKIDRNGTINEYGIWEGKRNRKPTLITKSDLHRIIKESVRLVLKNADI